MSLNLSEKVFRALKDVKNFGFNKFDTKIEFRFWAIVSLACWVETQRMRVGSFRGELWLLWEFNLLEITISNSDTTSFKRKRAQISPLFAQLCHEFASIPHLFMYIRLFCKFTALPLITSFPLVQLGLSRKLLLTHSTINPKIPKVFPCKTTRELDWIWGALNCLRITTICNKLKNGQCSPYRLIFSNAFTFFVRFYFQPHRDGDNTDYCELFPLLTPIFTFLC